jgi:hypothetical protein
MPTERSTTFDESSLLRLRFTGEVFQRRSVPIYELGISLVSVQRIINKAYLSERGRLKKGARLEEENRQRIALQIGSRERRSDGYVLTAFFSDPFVQPILQQVIASAITATAAYVLYKVHEWRRTPKETSQTLSIAIYDEVQQLADRVDGIGKADTLEIAPGGNVNAPSLIFNGKTKRYVRDLKREPVLGPITTIRGPITRLYPRRWMVEAVIKDRRVKIWLEGSNFNALRYRAAIDTIVDFTGHPLYRLGSKDIEFTEFRAEKIELVPTKGS